MTKAKTISLFWNNTLHTVVPNDDGMYNLNGLHVVSGYARSKAPSEWTRHNQAIELIEKYSKPGNPGLQVRRGNTANRGTWAIEELVYAYASWLSAEFYKAVLDAFTAAVAGNMVKVKEIVRTAVHYSNWRRYRLVIT
ncbi:KilA-N domain-containing protein [Salmonella enterica subsp. enterica]